MKISLADFLKSLDFFCRRAEREPITITRNNAPDLVLLSGEEYQKLKKAYREALLVEELDSTEREKLATAKIDDECYRFDDGV